MKRYFYPDCRFCAPKAAVTISLAICNQWFISFAISELISFVEIKYQSKVEDAHKMFVFSDYLTNLILEMILCPGAKNAFEDIRLKDFHRHSA